MERVTNRLLLKHTDISRRIYTYNSLEILKTSAKLLIVMEYPKGQIIHPVKNFENFCQI